MIEFLKILLFAKTVLLTTSPIDIGPHPVDISFDEPVSALTTGASIEIEISSMIDRKKYKTIREIRDYVDKGTLPVIKAPRARVQLYSDKGDATRY